MKNKLGIVGGFVLIAFGVWMLNITLDVLDKEGFNEGIIILFLMGVTPAILGFYILMNLDKEDNIEQVKQIKAREVKK